MPHAPRPDLTQLTGRLRHFPAVGQVTPLGNTLHVTGHDRAGLANAVQASAATDLYRVEEIEATLEDVFISLMGDATDNYQ